MVGVAQAQKMLSQREFAILTMADAIAALTGGADVVDVLNETIDPLDDVRDAVANGVNPDDPLTRAES